MDDEPAGVPEWVVTYGDMMSLLLTFFIMLVSLSEVVADSKYRAVMAALHSYLGYSMAPAAPAGKNYPLNSMVERMKSLGAFRDDVPKKKRGTGGVRIKAPQGTHLHVFRGREGTAITIGGELAFQKGSSKVTPEVADIVRTIAEKLAGKPNKIEVRGHSSNDEIPNDPQLDKVQLSYQRARAVVDLLVRDGVEQRRLRISAAGDTEPIDDIGDEDSVDHARVTIFALDTYSKEFVGTADTED